MFDLIAEIIYITAPVFMIIGAGYFCARKGVVNASATDGMMSFAIKIAIPCLLFRATSSIDLANAFQWRLFGAYYLAAISCFVVSIFLLRKFFDKRPGEAVAISFGVLFSNLVMLGLPISERAWGSAGLEYSYALVAVNAPICYLIGISVMEISRADGRGVVATVKVVANEMFRNSLMIGIGLGLIVNLAEIKLPGTLLSAIEMLATAALPVALFGLGGILTRYSMRRSRNEASLVTLLSLLLQPLLTLQLCHLFGLDESIIRTVVLMSAVAPGLNAYLFACMYQRGEGAAASSVLMATIASVFSVSLWLLILR